MNVWETVAEILRREGVEYLFNFPSHPLIDAGASLGIRPVVCRQERVGVGMADGYSRVNGGRKIGVFAMQAGPGAENAFPGVACAYADSSPILVLPMGQILAEAQVFPFFSAGKAYGSVTKSLETLTTPGATADVMRRAMGQLRNGRPGPVMVEIPKDVGGMEAPDGAAADYRPVVTVCSAGDPDAVAAAAEALVQARRPMIIAGQGVLYAEAWDELKELAELLGSPVATTLEGISAFPENHPLSLGSFTLTMRGAAPEFFASSDLVAGIGTSLPRGDLTPVIPAGKTFVHITNDAKDLNKFYFADYPVLGDAKLVLAQLLEAVRELLGDKPERGEAVQAEVQSLKATWLDGWMPKLTSNEVPLTPYRVIWDFVQTVDPAETIVTNDCGHPRHQLTPFYSATVPHGYVGWGKSHALGTGVGLIMGAKLARPDKLCVHFMGDAAFGMTGLDLETAVRNDIPALFVVFNNSTMATEWKSLVSSQERYGARNLSGDYSKIAEGLGLYAERIEDPSEIVPSITRARNATEQGRPALLEFITCSERELSYARLPSELRAGAERPA